MTNRFLLVVAAAVMMSTGLLAGRAGAGGAPSACLLGTFERDTELVERWTPQYGALLDLSAEHATHGARSCKVTCPPTPENHWRATGIRTGLLETDWRRYRALQFEVYNASTERQQLFVELRDGAERSERPFALEPESQTRIELPLDAVQLDLGHVELLSLYLVCPRSEVVLFVDDVRLVAEGDGPLRVPEIDRGARRVREALGDLANRLTRLPEDATKEALTRRRTEIASQLQRTLAAVGGHDPTAEQLTTTAETLAELAKEAESLREEVAREELLLAIWLRDGQVAFGLAGEGSATKVLRDYALFDSPLTDEVAVSLCANEHEAAQLIVLPVARDLTEIRVETSDLVCQRTDATLARENVRWFRVGYVKTERPRYAVDYVGWWPDPLIDQPSFDVALTDVLQPIWLEVFAPPGTPPGLYQGEVTLRPANASARTVTLWCRVWDFELPVEHHLKTAFSFSEGGYYRWYNSDYEPRKSELPQEVRRRLYAWLLEHRVSPTNIYRPYDYPAVPRWEDLEFCVERGLDSFNIGRLQSDELYLSYLREFTARLRSKGWLKYAYVYGPDEIQYRTNYAELKEEARRACELVHEVAPAVPILAAIDLDPGLQGYINAWVPLTSRCDLQLARKYRAAGDQVWWYWCTGAGHPGLYLDFPAIEARLLPWLCWSHNIDGFLYYAINLWTHNFRQPGQPRWPDVPWDPLPGFDRNAKVNGSGVLVYPGREYGELCSSIRFENIRDGLEDYEYLWLLRQRVEATGLAPPSPLVAEARELLKLEGVAESLQNHTRDPQQLLGRRSRVARAIESLAPSADGKEVSGARTN